MTARLLVVEDEPDIRELLSGGLRYAGYDVTAVATGGEALRCAAGHPPDLVVLDVMLPDLDGFTVLKQLRTIVDAPVVFLTARSDVDDRVTGLTLGGDDYVTKPFALEELIARIGAVLRRTAEAPTGRISVGDLELDEDSHEVRRAGQLVALSPTEFRLLRYLMLNAGRVVSKTQILDRVWSYDYHGEANIVELYVSYLRKKVDNHGPRLINTLRGVGYVLRAPRA
ncbi:DNA-binding response regulator [Longispora fulva]|uniref:Two-component system OmpR family response regulator n=1 Tax=Longispora fulva TaxID=619741 RepID=A0A8J7GEF6_9ACTN|nr:response regulator transcription factor [Longispora fulva]MBG6139113.1 two-component system OmpR family response regulator [Longispora fulva]GIG58605.1 DNA-binding response regulator [Longispora fulva]